MLIYLLGQVVDEFGSPDQGDLVDDVAEKAVFMVYLGVAGFFAAYLEVRRGWAPPLPVSLALRCRSARACRS